MPLLDIAIAQPCFPNHRFAVGFQSFYHVSFIFSNPPHIRLGSSSSWRYFSVPDKGNHPSTGYVNTRGSGLMIKAVATLEPRYSVQRNDSLQLGTHSRNLPLPENQSFGEDSEVIDEREKLRRMRISKANKGNTPWNKGRKHSPETLQRIRERTRLAMQDPKVKAKLVNLGHAQSEETRVKIGVGVRIGWEKRREKLMLQETCHFEWQNLIAEASRKGLLGEEELQWDSYKIIDAELKKEWLESVEERKRMPRPKGSKRAPKSPEQRRKISEAIAAKWADPTYRDRVFSGLSKYHGTMVGREKPKKKPKSEGEPKKTSVPKKKAKDSDDSTLGVTKSQRPKLKRRNTPMYKDPLASSKLEMIKSIRAQRAAAESTKSEAVARAKLLIAEAEKAAEALEIAATKSPLAQASLLETRKLIAEAIKSIESIEARDLEHGGSSSSTSNEKINHHTCEAGTIVEHPDHKEVNGTMTLALTDKEIMDIGFSKLDLEHGDLPTTSDHHRSVVNGKEQYYPVGDPGSSLGLSQENGSSGDLPPNRLWEKVDHHPKKHETAETRTRTTKRWVRGKLVEVAEDE